MTKSIEQIALEVVKDLGWPLDAVEHSDMQEFLRRCLAKIGEGLEPVAVITPKPGSYIKWKDGTYLSDGTSLYATPHEAIIAAEKWKLLAESNAKLAEIAQSRADREKRMNEAVEQRVAEACAKVCGEYDASPWAHDSGALHVADMVSVSLAKAIRSGEWRECQ